jgi:hypothetical protein
MKRFITLCCIWLVIASTSMLSQTNEYPSPAKSIFNKSINLHSSRNLVNAANQLANLVSTQPGNEKSKALFDGSWRMASLEYFNWVESTTTWGTYQKTSYTYDGASRRSVELSQSWNVSIYEDFQRTTYTYDGQGDNTLILSEYWYNDQWNNGLRKTITYDGSHHQSVVVSAMWAGISWMDESKTSYTYDGSGHETEMLQQNWSGSWQNSLRTNSTYDGNGFKTQMIFQSWETDHWLNQDRWTITNDGQGKPTYMLMEIWNNTAWTTSQQMTYTYNGSGIMTKVFLQMWYDSKWNNDYQELYTIDGNQNRTEMIGQLWNGSAWTNSSRYVYTWEQATGVDDHPLTVTRFALLNNYPNPFNPSTQIQFALPEANTVTLSIYDVLGKEVSRLVNERIPAGVHSATWDAAGMPSGVYFCRLTAGTFHAMKKMLLVK